MTQRRAVLVGAVESSRIALQALGRSGGWVVAGVVTLDPALSGRHSDHVDLTDTARRLGSTVVPVDNINRDEALKAIGALAADTIFVVGWSQICGRAFRELAPDQVVGYHPAPLPRLRGRAAIPWTILEQEPISAGTLFWIDDGVDTGAIVDQQFFHVAPGETAATLYGKHMEALAAMFDRSLPLLARDEAPRRRQDEQCATWAARRTPADGRIDWTRPADTVLRLVRAVGRPYPGAFSASGDRQLSIWAGAIAADGHRHCGTPGQVVLADRTRFTVLCGDRTALDVTEWSGDDRPPRLGTMLGGE